MHKQDNDGQRITGHGDKPEPGRRRLLAMASAGLAAAPFMGIASSAIAQTQSGGAAATVNASASGEFRIGGDLTVNRLGFGGIPICGPMVWGENDRRDEAIQLLKRLPELGVNLIDTADAYGPYVSENLIAEALAPYEGFPYEGAQIATKGGFVRPNPETDPWVAVGDPAYLEQCVRMSLRRLKLEQINLWHLHRVDPDVPETVQYEAIKSFIDKGLIRHAGLSEVSIEQIEAARKIFPVASVQNRYNLNDREHEDVLDYCEKEGIAFIPWWPLAFGTLARPGAVHEEIAKAKGVTNAQLAIAWLLQRSPVMLPIPGTSRLAHLEENVAAAGMTLTDEEFEAVDSIARPT
ncbi:aldo/keto reductase [Paenirhodobacter sp.]|uniref:aldo/keto reductase n=1 Tax=Paenirhodobacter sp. TaxID=1965326 RepID=UPI003B4184DA